MENNEGNNENNTNNQISDQSSEDMVKYSSYQKLLNEKKNLQKEYEGLRGRLDEIEQESLTKKEEFKTLYEKEVAAKKELLSKLEQQDAQRRSDIRKQSFLKELGTSLNRDEYINLAALDSIEVSDDGSVDPMSLKLVVSKFKEEHSSLIKTKVDPNQATSSGVPKNTSESVSFEDYSSMSYEDKIKHRDKVNELPGLAELRRKHKL